MQILLVEDDQSLATGLCKALRSEGFVINHVSKGKDALHTIGVEPPDMVVLDLVMPKMGGQEAAEAIRLIDKEVKILFVTGYIPETVTASLNEPIIRKPYKRSLFLKIIEEILGE